MTLLVVASVAGSPGATRLALGLAASWPDPDRRRVVVEADPDGGRLGAELGTGVEPGLMALALAVADLRPDRRTTSSSGAPRPSATGTSSRRRRRRSRPTRRSCTPPGRWPR